MKTTEREPTAEMVEAGADAYHEALAARKIMVEGYGREFKGAAPICWLAPVWLAMHDAAPEAPPLPQDVAGIEDAAWTWLESKFFNVEAGHDPNDRDYSADEMVDAFIAGRASQQPASVEDAAWPTARQDRVTRAIVMAFEASRACDATIVVHVHPNGDWSVFNAETSERLLGRAREVALRKIAEGDFGDVEDAMEIARLALLDQPAQVQPVGEGSR